MAAFKVAVFVLFISSVCVGKHFHSNSRYDSRLHDFEERLKDLQIKERNDDSELKPTADNLPKDGELFEGDMVMSPRLRDAVLGQEKRSAFRGDETKWKNGIIPYTFSKEIDPYMKKLIEKGFKVYKAYTCIKLVPRTGETDYVEFTSQPNTCSSSVGKIGGKQTIKLGIGCRVIGTVLHEIMHALGMIHEQSRPDRDEHVTVRMDNIKPNLIHNFNKYSMQEVTNLDVPYNFNSVLHYRNNAFTNNGQDTLSSINDPSLTFGQRDMFSSLDVKMINKLYHCGGKKVSRDHFYPDMTERDVLQKRDRAHYDDDDEDEIYRF